jgi:hypothetical protein
MCRSIKTLRKLDHPVTGAEIEAAVRQIASATHDLLADLAVAQAPNPSHPPTS